MASDADQGHRRALAEQLGDGAEYYVVHDGGAADGMTVDGPFALPTAAVKAKNRRNRESHFMCSFRVQEVPPDEQH